MIPKLLIAAGNYNISHSIKSTLESEGIAIAMAFSHRDTIYMLHQQRYNLLIVDAAMYDRQSGEPTLTALKRLKNPTPRIAVALNGTDAQRAEADAVKVMTDLGRDTVRGTIASVLGVNVQPARRQQTAILNSQQRVDEINMLFRVSKSLTQILDLSDLLNRVVEAARELTGADEGMILLPENIQGKEHLMLRAKIGIDDETARNFRVKIDDTVIGDVYRNGIPTIGGGAVKVRTEHIVNNVLYVPIKIMNRTLGVLGVNNTKKNESFDPHMQDLLVNLASYAAIAIENARVHEESIRRTQDLEKLVNASQIMSGSLAVAETYANICHQIGVVLDVSRTEIFFWNDDSRLLEKRAQYFGEIWLPVDAPTYVLDADQQKRIQAHKLFWYSEDRYHTLILPVTTTDDQLAGVLRACYITHPEKTPDSATVRDATMTAMETLADLLHTAEDRPIKRREILDRMSIINQQLDCDWCELGLLSEQGDTIRKVADCGLGVWMDEPYALIRLRDEPELRQVMSEQIVLQEFEDNAKIILPLVHREETLGVVIVMNNNLHRVFTPREIDIAQALVAQAATALENSRLLSDLERSYVDLKAAQEKLVQTARYSAMGELAAVVAHQINNPLTTIIVDSQLLLEFEDQSNPRYRSLQAIHSAGRRASGVARRLLSVVRPTEPDDVPEMIDAFDSLYGVLELLSTHIQRRNITIEQNLPPKGEDLPPVMAVKGQLDDIWLNLLSNAYDAMSDRPESRLGIDGKYNEETGKIEVVIWDNGPGIPKEKLQKVFEPFFTTKPAGEGTGLGLHIVRQVIESVDGTIEIESEVDVGTRFTITLPTVARKESSKVAEGKKA